MLSAQVRFLRAPLRASSSPRVVSCSANEPSGRREFVLKSANVAVLGSIFSWGASSRPSNLGVQDYGGGIRQLSLCPPSPNCVSTSEELNDPDHFIPGWTYGRKKSQEEAMKELVEVIEREILMIMILMRTNFTRWRYDALACSMFFFFIFLVFHDCRLD